MFLNLKKKLNENELFKTAKKISSLMPVGSHENIVISSGEWQGIFVHFFYSCE